MEGKGFDASRYLTRVEGREYLEVKWRLLWLRTEHPDAILETELSEHREGYALFKARVVLPSGGEASGWGSETVEQFEEYLEAAETKALGRALAALGYGTQFCQDFALAAESAEPVVDAPIPLHQPLKSNGRARQTRATEAQVNAIYAIARQVYSWDERAVEQKCLETFKRSTGELSKGEASRLIDDLKAKKLGA